MEVVSIIKLGEVEGECSYCRVTLTPFTIATYNLSEFGTVYVQAQPIGVVAGERIITSSSNVEIIKLWIDWIA